MRKPKLTICKQVDKSYQELYEDYLKVAKINNLLGYGNKRGLGRADLSATKETYPKKIA